MDPVADGTVSVMQAIGHVEVITDNIASAAAKLDTQPSQQLDSEMQERTPEASVLTIPQA